MGLNIDLSGMSMYIGAALGVTVVTIILLTVAPGVAGDLDQIALNGEYTCEYNGERFMWLSVNQASTGTDDSETTWGKTNPANRIDMTNLEQGNVGSKCLYAAVTGPANRRRWPSRRRRAPRLTPCRALHLSWRP